MWLDNLPNDGDGRGEEKVAKTEAIIAKEAEDCGMEYVWIMLVTI